MVADRICNGVLSTVAKDLDLYGTMKMSCSFRLWGGTGNLGCESILVFVRITCEVRNICAQFSVQMVDYSARKSRTGREHPRDRFRTRYSIVQVRAVRTDFGERYKCVSLFQARAHSAAYKGQAPSCAVPYGRRDK